MKRRFVWLGVAALALGLAVLAYRGPGRAVIRGHAGDVAATMLVYALVGGVWTVRRRVRAAATLAIATAIELGQLAWHARSLAGELLIGSTFDAVDFVAYVLGIAIAVAWDARTSEDQSRASTSTSERVVDAHRPTRARMPAGYGRTTGRKPHDS